MIKKAVIVAAGLSSRLYPLTLESPKGLLEINNQQILNRSIDILKKNGIDQVSIVVGYKESLIKKKVGEGVTYIANPFYKHCNNMGSLWFAKEFVNNDPFVYLHGDVVFDEDLLKSTLNKRFIGNYDIELVTDYGPTDEEAMKVMIDHEKYLIKSHKGISSSESDGEWTGIAYVNNSKALFEQIEHILFNESLNEYDTYAFTRMVEAGGTIYCSSTENLPWIEIDFLEDYKLAKKMFEDE
ncbi:phosphocholine cytidylyltransferase family protein [Paenibacillus sp. IHBB 10380]|uniref:phosphocholine cytidylyltransferase family protein n=1 Tax=Paenibacillus sp. IHBB 10380 TaxID=1566358 RepID=UPI0005CF9F9F|nr:phosphocholine cytidylyltransferase family protein [Paenibacillus sp. IHBB 10380]AJS60367.1 hypothetical protein UB51_20090 [Paenibacillus sp. IHBB 10380]